MTLQKYDKNLLDNDLFKQMQVEDIEEYLKIQKSENSQKYQEFFSDVEKFNIEKVQEMHYKLREHGFVISQNTKSPYNDNSSSSKVININDNFFISVYPKTSNWQVVQLDCKLGIYRKRFLILNEYGQKQHYFKLLSMGSMGQIYHYRNQNQNIAIKCIKIKAHSSQSIMIGIKQYFIMNMMSVLQIGPKIKHIAGFDFICSRKCLEFSMEYCKPIYQKDKLTEENFKSLKILLKKMHLLKLIHFDIKPSNIMFSNQFKKYVFIDFGVSELINQGFGQKTLTNFRGTIQFCGEQLKKCFLQRKSKYVDLYFNDVECLSNAFASIKNQKGNNLLNNVDQTQNNGDNAQIQNSIILALIKFYLIKKEIQNAQILIFSKKSNTEKLLSEIYVWLTFLPRQISYQMFGEKYYKYSKNLKQYQKFQSYYSLENPFSKKNDQKKQITNCTHFQTFYRNIQNLLKFSSFFPSKNKAKQTIYALDSQPLQQTNFTALVSYLSFCKNIFNTNLEQKYQASKRSLQILIKSHNICIQRTEQFISEQIQSQNLKTVIKCINICLYIAQNNIQNDIFRNLCIDLLQQIIFLNYKAQSSQKLQKLFYKVMEKQKNIIKKIHIFMRYYYGLTKQMMKINISRQLFKFLKTNKKYFSLVIQPKMKQLKIQIQAILLNDISYAKNQKQFYICFLETIIRFLSTMHNELWQCWDQQYLCQYFGMIWDFMKNYKQMIYGETFQNLFQIIILLIFHDQYKLNLDRYTSKEFRKQYAFYNQKNSNIITKIDFSLVSLYFEDVNFNKLKYYLRCFDQKINCLQISDLFFKVQRLLLAFLFNDESQIKKYSEIMFKQNHNNQIKQNIILKIRCFSRFQKSKLILMENRQNLYHKIRNWMLPTVLFCLQKYSNSYEQKQFQQNFFKSRLLLHAFYQLIQNDFNFLKRQKLCLLAMKDNFQKIYFKIEKDERRTDLYINMTLSYFRDIQKDIIKQISFLINLDLKEFQNLNYFSNLFFIKRLIQIKRTIQKRLPNFFIYDKQNAFLYEMLVITGDIFFLYPLQFKQLILFYSLSHKQIKIFKIFLIMNTFLKQKWNLLRYKNFIKYVKRLIHPKQCKCKFDYQYKKSYQILTNQFINNLKQGKIKYNVQSYFAVPFALYVLVVKQFLTLQQTRRILIFIAKSFHYLDKFTKSQLLENYYKFHLNLHQINCSKYFKVYKKYILSSKNIKFSSQLIKNIYFKIASKTLKKKKKISSSHYFQQIISKKIQRIQSCIFYNNSAQLKQENQIQLTSHQQKQQDRRVGQIYNSKYKLNEVNQKIMLIVFGLKKRFQNLLGMNHFLFFK